METNISVKNAFKNIVSLNCWNRYRETSTLLAYISNFLFLFDSLNPRHLFTSHYKFVIMSAIFSVLSSIDCEIDSVFIREKFPFMQALRQKNISLEVILNHKKHDLTSDQIEQLEFYDKFDILFKYVVHYFDKILKMSPKKWVEFIPLMIKVFDHVLINFHNTIAVQFFWFYFTSINKVIVI